MEPPRTEVRLCSPVGTRTRTSQSGGSRGIQTLDFFLAREALCQAELWTQVGSKGHAF